MLIKYFNQGNDQSEPGNISKGVWNDEIIFQVIIILCFTKKNSS